MAIGRISGPLLAKNLLRDGIDLAFETDLLYLDVKNGRIGVRKGSPLYELDVNGTINANNLRVVYTGPGTGKATLGKLEINSGTISTTVGPLNIRPSGNEDVNIYADTNVLGNFYASGNISAGGDIILGNNTATDTVVFESEIASDIIPASNGEFSLGSTEKKWLDAYVENLVTQQLISTGTFQINGASLVEINADLRVRGKNPLGTAPVITNVLHVTMDGDDTNDGRSSDPSRACRTISGAIRSPYYRPGTLIRVYSGHYLENNPILLQPNTAVIGDDLRTCSIEPINKTQDLFNVQSGCYLAQMQFFNGRSGLLPGPYTNNTNRGAYCTAFPPQVGGAKIDLYQSPYIQNCTNQSGPWLVDGTLFVPNQTIQIPQGIGTASFEYNTTTIVVTLTTGTIAVGQHVTSGPQDPGFFSARTLLLSNLEFVQDQTVAWINTQISTATIGSIWYEFDYEQAKCYRDVGLITQAITYDATFGGNEKSVEAGLAYWNGVINYVEGQQDQTTAAINYINTLCQAIITNTPIQTYSSATTQIINTALVNGVVASEELTDGVSIITTIINSGTSYAPEIFKSCGPETPLVSAELLLEKNRTFLQTEVVAYVDATYPNFTYRKDLCYRDVGLIVDAVSQDLLVGGNTKTIEAALSYYTGSKGDSSVAETAIINNFVTIKDIIANGPSVAPTPISGPNQGTGFSNAKDILLKNKTFLQTEVSAYVRSLFNSEFRLTQTQQNLCYRDIGTILEAIAEDTAAGGNVKTVEAGLAYYEGSVSILPGNQTQYTVLTLNYMQSLCQQIVKNSVITGLYQTVIPQNFANPAATTVEVDAINNNLDLITEIITTGPGIAPSPEPISLSLNTSSNAYHAFKSLEANRNFIAAELNGWIDDVFGGGFNYNTATCYRDTGLIVDSLAFDLLQQDNSQAIFAGLQYWNQSGYTGQIGNELTTTTAAINYAKSIAQQIVVNSTVTSLQATVSQVFDLGNPGSTGSVAVLGYLFNTVTNLLTVGTAGVTGQIVPNSTATNDTGIVNAYDLLQSNKDFIKEQVVAYVDDLVDNFTYDRTKCARDIGLIVDSITQDLLFDGTSQSTFSGLQYWAQGTTSIPGEISTTTIAIEYVKDLAQRIIVNDTSGQRYQNSVLQVTTSTGATVAEQQVVYDEFNLIIDLINNGTAGVSDIIVPNAITTSTNINVQAAYNLLVANKSYIQTEAIAYVNSFKPKDFVYDVGKCYRDVGYMVDSVAFDLYYGGNRQAVQSGVYYYGFDGAETTVPNEQVQVTAAYNYIKELSNYVVKGLRPPTLYQTAIPQVILPGVGTASEVTTIQNNIDVITDIINLGPGVAAAPEPISLTASTATAVVNASTIMAANRDFFKAEIVAYIDSVYPTTFTYDKDKCKRDVGYILDCISFDLLHGGNRQSIQSGVYYYSYNQNSSTLTYEIAQVTAAYNRIKEIAGDIIQGIAITPTPGNASSQIIDTSSATSAEADYIGNDIDIMLDIINNGPNRNYPKEPITLSSSTDPAVIDAFDLLLANKEFIQNELVAYVNYWFVPAFVYDKIKCERDTKLIVDSVALDLLYDGDTQSTFAGLQYWAQGTTTIPGEETTTTNAIIHLTTVTTALLSGYTAAIDSINTNSNLIVNIISSGTVGITDLVIPNSTPSTNTATVAAYNIIQTNKSAIQQNTVDWVTATNPGFVYNTSTCYRDVGYILDCLSFDLLHGGNRQSIQAGAYYYGFSTTATNVYNEIPQVVAAYNQLKYLIEDVILNNPIERSYQLDYEQVIIPAYMGVTSLIAGQEVFTVDAINYLNLMSQRVIDNLPVQTVRGDVSQYFNYTLEGGSSAGSALTRNYTIITDVIANGPGAAPIPFTGSGFFATTGVSTDDVRRSPIVISITTQTGNVYTIKLNNPTTGNSQNGTLYFGDTLVFPATDEQVEELSLEYTGNAYTYDSRKVDPIGAMGGSLVDGGVISDRSPIQSFVYDAFTQVSQGGKGVRVTNNGYAQLVSVFTIFCSVGVQVDNGGIASIVNSNANFGDICLLANGFGKKEFSGTIYNPSYPTYVPNGEYYPLGYYPQNGIVEVYIPDASKRPHISLVMEVEPPLTTIDYQGNVIPYTNDQGFPGFLNATPSAASLTTGSIVITDVDTTGIAVGNSLYVRDQYGNTGTTDIVFKPYVLPGTVVTDVGYRTVTLNQGLGSGGADPTNNAQSTNGEYFNLYFCGNAYYTVLSSEVNNNFGKPLGTNILSTASGLAVNQIPAELNALDFINSTLTGAGGLFETAGVNAASVAFVDNCIENIIKPIINAVDVTTAEDLFTPTKTGTPPAGASLAISVITTNVETIVTDTINHINATYPGLTYNVEKCKRDVRLILEQLVFDLETGGNYYSVYSGLSYWYRADTHHIVNLEEAVTNTALFPDGASVNFYQRSYMSASGYVFEYVGAGVTYSALPQRGIKDPVQGKEVVQVNNGKVFFTSTDQNGDFRIGPGLVISQATGVLSGRTFTKSLFANMTPFILAVEGG